MMVWLSIWWVWIGIALIVAIVELLLPGFIFLGIALGALILGILQLILPDTFGALSFNETMALFAGLSLVSWLVLKRAFRNQSSGKTVFTKDIND